MRKTTSSIIGENYMYLVLVFTIIVALGCNNTLSENHKPRIIISSDIGGTDPDDFQSMIHLLMYANMFQIEGLIASPYGKGRKEDIIDMINLYEEDLTKLRQHAEGFPDPQTLRAVCKQGATSIAGYDGYANVTEGSDWIVTCANKQHDEPLWVLVWGGLEDLAQALHDAPHIKEKIKVYWIGGPNKKWSVNAYSYIAKNHPDLWMIEANATYRGWFIDDDSPEHISEEAYYQNYIHGRGAMGKNFINYYNGKIKMGDSPSLTYVMNGDPNDPLTESWGGNFTPITHSSCAIFNGNSTVTDTVPAYAVLEWNFDGPELNIPRDSACFTMEISKQVWSGYYLGDGVYAIRYSPKKPEVGSYRTTSNIPALNGLTGQYVSVTPWPGKLIANDYKLGNHWYSDRSEPELFIGIQQGAKTVSMHREAFLLDWASRWKWL